MKTTAFTFVIINKNGTFTVSDYGTSSGTMESAYMAAKRSNMDAVMVIPKWRIDEEQQFKPTNESFARGLVLGILIGSISAIFLYSLIVNVINL